MCHCCGRVGNRISYQESSTLGGESQAYASGVAERCLLILAEALDGPFSLREVDTVIKHRVSMTDRRSLYDHLVSLGRGGPLVDKRTAIDVSIIRQSIQRTSLQPWWVATTHMAADGLTKDKGKLLDLLRSIIKNHRYQLADEQLVLDREKE